MKANEVRCNVGMWDVDDALALIKSIYMNPVPVKAEDFEEDETETVSRNHKARGRAYRRNERHKHIAKRKQLPVNVKFDGQLDKGKDMIPVCDRGKKQWNEYCKHYYEEKSLADMKLAAKEKDARNEKETEVPIPFYGVDESELKRLYNMLYDLEDRRWELKRERERIDNAIYEVLDDMMNVNYAIQKLEGII